MTLAKMTSALVFCVLIISCDQVADVPTDAIGPQMVEPANDLITSAYKTPEQEYVELIDQLVAEGADVNARTNYGETPLNVSFKLGKPLAVRKLLSLGADPASFGWTDLHFLAVKGNIEALKAASPSIERLLSRDNKGRTPFLLAVKMGDIPMADYLLSITPDAGRFSIPDNRGAVLLASEHARLEMVEWLLEQGFAAGHASNFGETALHVASQTDSTELVSALIEAGADVNATYNLSAALNARSNKQFGGLESEHETIFTPMDNASSGAIAWHLYKAGAPLQSIPKAARRQLTGAPLMQPISQLPIADFAEFSERTYGRSNPEISNNPFWRQQIRTGASAFEAFDNFGGATRPEHPIWSFDRFGASLTPLPDGRWIEIAGEHEDFYDWDFCIYNDVVVHDGNGQTLIYTYPKDVFPNTDFHSATHLKDSIIIIGNLGYQDERRADLTPVHQLNLEDFSIQRIVTSGSNPGWISGHDAELRDSALIISGGQIWDGDALLANDTVWKLDTETFIWSVIAETTQ